MFCYFVKQITTKKNKKKKRVFAIESPVRLYKIESDGGNSDLRLIKKIMKSIKKIGELMAQKTRLQTALNAADAELKKEVGKHIEKIDPSFDKDKVKPNEPKVFLLRGVDYNVKVTFSYISEYTKTVKAHPRQSIAPEDKKAFTLAVNS